MAQSSRRSNSNLWLLGVSAGVACLLVVSLYLAGCSETPAPVSPAGVNNQTNKDEHCDDLIGSAFSMLQPDRLGITAEPTEVVNLFNEWLTSCGSSQQPVADGAAEPLLKKLLSADAYQRAMLSRFVERDAEHVRNCLLDKLTLEFAMKSGQSELRRVVDLFHYVVRNVQLVEPSTDAIPFTPFEIMLFGKGTAEDRAWIFANLLRQLRIDSVIVRPSQKQAAVDERKRDRGWLVGVLLDGRVFLFDTRLGWPIPSAQDDETTTTVMLPATLSEVLEHDGLLRRLDLGADRAYPLRKADLKNVGVELIGHSELWAERIKQVQMPLSGKRSVIVSDPLEDGESKKGLLARVAECGQDKWQADDIAVWSYPERQLAGFDNLDDSQSARLRVRKRAFAAPITISFDPAQSRVVKSAKRTLLKTRIAQLLGKHDEAILSYMTIRLGGNMPPFLTVTIAGRKIAVPVPPEIIRTHAEAAENASFWIGLCKFEQGKVEKAAEHFFGCFERYLEGPWAEPCRTLRASSRAANGDYGIAIELLEEGSPDDPQRDGHDLLVRRWKKILVSAAAKK